MKYTNRSEHRQYPEPLPAENIFQPGWFSASLEAGVRPIGSPILHAEKRPARTHSATKAPGFPPRWTKNKREIAKGRKREIPRRLIAFSRVVPCLFSPLRSAFAFSPLPAFTFLFSFGSPPSLLGTAVVLLTPARPRLRLPFFPAFRPSFRHVLQRDEAPHAVRPNRATVANWETKPSIVASLRFVAVNGPFQTQSAAARRPGLRPNAPIYQEPIHTAFPKMPRSDHHKQPPHSTPGNDLALSAL